VVQVSAGHPLVLVTGATGFVGSAFCDTLSLAGYGIRRALRRAGVARPNDVVVGEIDGNTNWAVALSDVECVVHLAARTHVLHDTAADPVAEYRRINVAGTRRLAEEAARSGVRRFLLLSSVKVNGETTTGKPFRESDTPQPEDAYGVTKREAEELLSVIARRAGLETVMLRPPLVYGPGVKGNFLRLMRLIARGVPLPVASVKNQRSLIYVGNLADAMLACLRLPEAAGRTYLVSDGEDMSTPALVTAIGDALGVRARMLRCPVSLLDAGGALLGKSGEVARLTRSLEIDASLIRRELGWTAPFSVSHGLADTARWYHAHLASGSSAE
jgi:nucleoside-diphosphate-sugar epimerase